MMSVALVLMALVMAAIEITVLDGRMGLVQRVTRISARFMVMVAVLVADLEAGTVASRYLPERVLIIVLGIVMLVEMHIFVDVTERREKGGA